MPLVPAILLAVVVAAAGAYYLFASPAAGRLAGLEGAAANGRRRRLRRANGGVLLAVAGLFVSGAGIDSHHHPGAYLTVWGTLIVLLAVVMALATADVRLTAALRRNLRR